jgi:hypothetical protein
MLMAAIASRVRRVRWVLVVMCFMSPPCVGIAVCDPSGGTVVVGPKAAPMRG